MVWHMSDAPHAHRGLQGKISREDVADLCVALLGCPAAACTTFEVRSTVPFSQPWTGPQGGAAAAGDVPRRVREWQVSLIASELRVRSYTSGSVHQENSLS